jgi:hypothetical protein
MQVYLSVLSPNRFNLGSLLQGFAIALGYLYSSVAMSMIHPNNARAVLAAGCLLGGMEDLCRYSYEMYRQSISVDTIGSWIELVDSLSPSGDGSSTPDVPKPSIFGFYGERLRDDLYHFLVESLPDILGVRQPPTSTEAGNETNGREVLLDIYSRLPFDLFKTAVESPTFRIGGSILPRPVFHLLMLFSQILQVRTKQGSSSPKTLLIYASVVLPAAQGQKRRWF